MQPKNALAQERDILNGIKGRVGNLGSQQSRGKDTLGFQHRDDLADSITISYRYLDSLKSNRLDSSLDDFYTFFSIPPNYVSLGNNGSPAYPVLFSPVLKAGWDAGFHAFDAYRFTLENSRFYKTTRPFSQITYLLASGKEQFINILHTQNIKPNWNFGFQYKLITAPGFFKTQNTNHNSYRLFSNYQGNKKRYAAYFILMGNKLTASENGGIRSDTFLTNSDYSRRFTVPVNLGGDAPFGNNIFSTKVSTGNFYTNFTAFFRQSYDFGKRDSIAINDTTEEYLFYPKLRFQHTITYNTYGFHFSDQLPSPSDAVVDSAIFKQWYDTTLNINSGLNFSLQDKWKIITNDFVLRQFPETKNPAQFIEAGLRLENISGKFSHSTFFPQLIILPIFQVQTTYTNRNYFNTVLHGEYRNRTKNKKWDALAKGEFYVTGLNLGDYNAYASLTRFLNSKLGDVQIIFQNVSRTPSFIFNDLSSFNLSNHLAQKKENTTVLYLAAENPKFTISFRNTSIANYTYFKNYYQIAQYGSLINLTQVQAYRKSRVSKRFSLYSDFIIQQTAGNSPVRVPLFYTRQRFAFEGVFFKNLNLVTGLDVNYNTLYKANNYSPVEGQFFPQDTTTINNLPAVAFFFNFRIKTFTGLLRLENLNTASVNNGFGFTNNNFAAPHYPTPGLLFRIGVQWRFIN
ncbi:MAG: hypothetical protein H0W12_09085 [Chitinophagaceae bacterium]|nr:hypothetical protein [Chitinophagaceae bacterium]